MRWQNHEHTHLPSRCNPATLTCVWEQCVVADGKIAVLAAAADYTFYQTVIKPHSKVNSCKVTLINIDDTVQVYLYNKNFNGLFPNSFR